MATVRGLKKDVDFLIDEVIWDCMLYMQFNANKKAEEVEKILTQAVDLRNDLFDRINHPDGKHEPKLVKTHYRAVANDLLTGANGLFEQISKLAK